jgi:hypothetical protein
MRKISTTLTLLLILLASGLALAHGGGHVMGTVTALTADHIEVKTKEGKTITVPLAKTTQVLQGEKKATRKDIHIGSRVVVHRGTGGAAELIKLPKKGS